MMGCSTCSWDDSGSSAKLNQFPAAKWEDVATVCPGCSSPCRAGYSHNNGDGTFTDVSKESEIAGSLGKAWGVVATDINNDGLMDPICGERYGCQLSFANRGKGRFEEIGLQADVAYNAEGQSRSGMGCDSADFNEDGWMDLFVANINEEIYSPSIKTIATKHSKTKLWTLGIGMATRSMSGWGLKFLDYDNDGNLDLFLANGHPDDLIEEVYSGVKYSEPLMLFQNTGTAFQNVSQQSGPVFAKSFSSRGLAIGDFNNDGAVDVLISVNDGAPVLLRNNNVGKNHWLGVRLIGKNQIRTRSGPALPTRQAILKRNRMKVGGGSFLSSHDPRIVLGTGKQSKITWLEVRWPQPSGAVERFTGSPHRSLHHDCGGDRQMGSRYWCRLRLAAKTFH